MTAARDEAGAAASTRYLVSRLALVEARVRREVERRRAHDADPDDRFRGLYISERDVDELLRGQRALVAEDPDGEAAAQVRMVEAWADDAESQGADLRLRRLRRGFDLDDDDLELLMIALAPDLDPRFERLYGYLQDDVSRRRASPGLALELCGTPWYSAEGRGRFAPSSGLLAGGLLVVEEQDRPFLTRALRVPDRVASFLVGDDSVDAMVRALEAPVLQAEIGDAAAVERAMRAGATLVYVREPSGGAGLSLAATALGRLGMPVLALDLGRLGAKDDLAEVAHRAAREARLCHGAIVAWPVEAIVERGTDAVRVLAEAPAPAMVIIGSRSWDPQWAREVPLLVQGPVASVGDRCVLWNEAFVADGRGGLDPLAATVHFRLTPTQIVRAARAARLHAAAAGRDVAPADLAVGVRAQNAAGLERLARRVEPKVDWGDLVLAAPALAQLRELAARVRQRDRVLDDWGMGRRSSKGRGITALFAGDSGTGKTISAEVVAGDLGMDLYVIDLATVIDKYIGETEKNLDRIFAEADRVNGVLLFDEADAIFGKRSEVKDSHDRYANLEVAYLLQRMELFDGLAVLTTNLRSNVDEAFTRRLDAIVDFPMPEIDDRSRLWSLHLKPDLPRADDVDVDFLARAFRLSGGSISNIAVSAAYLAAASDRPVAMLDLIRGTESEYRKLGHLCVESEFGQYYPQLAGRLG